MTHFLYYDVGICLTIHTLTNFTWIVLHVKQYNKITLHIWQLRFHRFHFYLLKSSHRLYISLLLSIPFTLREYCKRYLVNWNVYVILLFCRGFTPTDFLSYFLSFILLLTIIVDCIAYRVYTIIPACDFCFYSSYKSLDSNIFYLFNKNNMERFEDVSIVSNTEKFS